MANKKPIELGNLASGIEATAPQTGRIDVELDRVYNALSRIDDNLAILHGRTQWFRLPEQPPTPEQKNEKVPFQPTSPAATTLAHIAARLIEFENELLRISNSIDCTLKP